MKKFNFSLDTVLSYKQQILDSLKAEHAAVIARMNAQEKRLSDLWTRYREYDAEFAEAKFRGLSITEALMFENGLRALERDIQRETLILERIQKEEEKKRGEVVEARKDTMSLEKLREKKLAGYTKELQKAEEALIDELVSAARASGSVIQTG